MVSDPRKVAVAGALAASLALVPTAAARGPEGGRDGGGSSSVQRQLRVADRALDRAVDFAEDGDTAKAAAAFNTNKKRIARALRIAKRTKSGRGVERVSRAQHNTAANAIDLVDGAGDDLVAVLDTAIDGALDGRDDLLALAAGVDESDREGFARLLAGLGAASASEIADIADSYGGTLTDSGRALLRSTLAREAASVEAVAAALEGWGAAALEERSLARLLDEIEDAQSALGGLSGLSGADADAVSAALASLGGAHAKVAALISAVGGESSSSDGYPSDVGDRDCGRDGRDGRGPRGEYDPAV